VSQIAEQPGVLSRIESRLLGEFRNWMYGGCAVNAEMMEKSLTAISWKEDRMMAAVAFPDDSIHFYDLEEQRWNNIVLRNEQMVGIQSISWKPSTLGTLAVSCINGLFIWSRAGDNEGVHCIRFLSLFP
jgi:hypothetical protein